MDYFYALAEPRRRKIIEILANEGQLTATQISSKFDVTAQAISQHLKVLLDAKLVRMEKNAQQHLYELNPDSMLEVEEWSKDVLKIWNDKFDRLDQLLEDEKKKAKLSKGHHGD